MAKRIIAIQIFTMFCILKSVGQIQGKEWMVALSGSYSQTKNQTTILSGVPSTRSGNSFVITPDVGYFLSKSFAIRLFSHYGRSFSKFDSPPISSESISTTASLGLSVRYYLPLAKRFYGFSQLGYQFQQATTKFKGQSLNPDRTKNYSFGIGSLGFLYFLSEQVGVEAVGDYNINFEEAILFKLGLRYLFRKQDAGTK